MNHYQLMNKDNIILEFSCKRDEFDEPVFSEDFWMSDLKPIGFTSVSSFLERRKAPKHREHIQDLLIKYGCNDIEGFIKVTHAASLNDTFWVRETDSPIVWNDISLFRNDFNELISLAAFEGIIPDEDISSTSPEFTTNGAYAKCWVREDDTIFLYKTGSKIFEIEPLSEFLATQLSNKLCTNAVKYDLDFFNGKLISKCALFTDEMHGFAPMSRLYKQKVSVNELLDYFDKIGSGDDFRRMCILDALIFNTDRHFGNFGVLFNNDTMDILGMAPVFDNNRSLFYSVDEDCMRNFSYYVRNAVPRLGTDFNITASQLLTPSIRSDLKNLLGFNFEQHPVIEASQQRLDNLSRLVDSQINLILNRVPVKTAVSLGKYNFESLESKIKSANSRRCDDKNCTRSLKGPEL